MSGRAVFTLAGRPLAPGSSGAAEQSSRIRHPAHAGWSPPPLPAQIHGIAAVTYRGGRQGIAFDEVTPIQAGGLLQLPHDFLCRGGGQYGSGTYHTSHHSSSNLPAMPQRWLKNTRLSYLSTMAS